MNQFGPRAIKKTHSAYNESVCSSLDEQLLTNMVRMKYRDNPFFLEINSITHAQEQSGKFDLNFEKTIIGGSNRYQGILKPGIGGASIERPTVYYTPLTGKAFIEKLLTPIQLPIIISLVQSGWRVDRVFNLCIERINNLYNAPTASGPTPIAKPKFEEFSRFISLLKVLHDNELITFGELPGKTFSDFAIKIENNNQYSTEIDEFKTLAGIDLNLNSFKLKSNFMDLGKGKLVFRLRSLMGMMFMLAQGIDVPEDHIKKGLVTVTVNDDGTEFDWNKLGKHFLDIKCRKSALKPDNAFIACRYRDTWFYISDDDLESKTTFMLLSQIFTLQSSRYKNEPLLILK